jgi:hypothetical protein
LGEKVKDEDFSQKFLMCLPKRFKTLRTIIFRGGLKDLSPNEVLGDVMTEDQYNDDDDEVVKEEDKKKKSVTFRAGTSSSKNKSKGKAKKEDSIDEECSNDDSDDEALCTQVWQDEEEGLSYKKEKRSLQEQGICEVMLQVQESRSHYSGLSLQ